MLNANKETKISSAVTITAGAAGTSDINGSALDMSGYESVRLILQTGAIVSGGVQTLKWQQGDQSDLSDAQDLASTEMTIADDDDDEVFISDLVKPVKRYVRAVVPRATQNATVAAVYEQYGGMKTPATQPSGVTAETNVSPAEGTA